MESETFRTTCRPRYDLKIPSMSNLRFKSPAVLVLLAKGDPGAPPLRGFGQDSVPGEVKRQRLPAQDPSVGLIHHLRQASVLPHFRQLAKGRVDKVIGGAGVGQVGEPHSPLRQHAIHRAPSARGLCEGDVHSITEDGGSLSRELHRASVVNRAFGLVVVHRVGHDDGGGGWSWTPPRRGRGGLEKTAQDIAESFHPAIGERKDDVLRLDRVISLPAAGAPGIAGDVSSVLDYETAGLEVDRLLA